MNINICYDFTKQMYKIVIQSTFSKRYLIEGDFFDLLARKIVKTENFFKKQGKQYFSSSFFLN